MEIIRESEETKEVTIKAACQEGINFVIYNWNDERENKVNLNGSTNFERIIDIPEKEISKLKVQVISVYGIKNEKEEEFELDVDLSKPTIDSITIIDKKLQIEVSDNEGIDYIKYQWEDEDEVVINMGEENNKTFSTRLEIKRGTYKLKLTVADIYGNTEVISKLITGVNEPEIKAIKYGNIVHVTVTHDMGFKMIQYIVNDKVYEYDEEYSKYDKNKKTIELDFPLKEGENLIQVNAYSLEKISDEETEEDDLANYSFKSFTGKCTYEP